MTDIDFAKLKTAFDQLSPGSKADIRRVAAPEDLDWLPAFYRLLPPGVKPNDQWKRIIFLLPWAAHAPGAKPLGRAMHDNQIAEMRIFQMAKSEFPQDIIHLRRILRQMKTSLDWTDFGQSLFFWSDNRKKAILRDYFYTSKAE
ncbi:MAG: type I-E CRISPR-associated protein Cse2/CasB [Thermodesulfobacteriota bacterium]